MTTDPGHPADPGPGLVSEPSGVVSVKVRNGVAVAITATWIGGIIADAAIKDFSLSASVYSVMAAMAASIFGSSFVRGAR